MNAVIEEGVRDGSRRPAPSTTKWHSKKGGGVTSKLALTTREKKGIAFLHSPAGEEKEH